MVHHCLEFVLKLPSKAVVFRHGVSVQNCKTSLTPPHSEHRFPDVVNPCLQFTPKLPSKAVVSRDGASVHSHLSAVHWYGGLLVSKDKLVIKFTSLLFCVHNYIYLSAKSILLCLSTVPAAQLALLFPLERQLTDEVKMTLTRQAANEKRLD